MIRIYCSFRHKVSGETKETCVLIKRQRCLPFFRYPGQCFTPLHVRMEALMKVLINER